MLFTWYRANCFDILDNFALNEPCRRQPVNLCNFAGKNDWTSSYPRNLILRAHADGHSNCDSWSAFLFYGHNPTEKKIILFLVKIQAQDDIPCLFFTIWFSPLLSMTSWSARDDYNAPSAVWTGNGLVGSSQGLIGVPLVENHTTPMNILIIYTLPSTSNCNVPEKRHPSQY